MIRQEADSAAIWLPGRVQVGSGVSKAQGAFVASFVGCAELRNSSIRGENRRIELLAGLSTFGNDSAQSNESVASVIGNHLHNQWVVLSILTSHNI